MARQLTGQVVLVTGASSGIGRAAAHAFARHRSRLVLAARSPEPLEHAASECRHRGAEVVTLPTDVGDAEQVEALRRRALDAYGRIDVWVDVAGMLVAAPIVDDDVRDVRRLVDTNVIGEYLCSQAALRTFRAQGEGVLINVASLLGLVPNPLVPAYVMSKFAVRGLSLSLRRAVADAPDIHVCLVMPGPVDTPMFDRAANRTGRELRAIPPAYAPERVAATIVRCARRPRRQATAGVLAHLILVSHRLSPRVAEWAVAQWSARALVRPQPEPSGSGALFEAQPRGRVHGGYRLGALRRRLGERIGRWSSHRGAPRATASGS